METPSSENPAGHAPPRRWPFFLLGVLLFVLGPALFAVQYYLQDLRVPWYVPILATVGVLLMALSVWQRRSLWRIVGLVLFALLCGREWYQLAVGTRTELYTGPAQPGQKIPEFATTLADGASFTDKDLEKGGATVLLFFRGRW